MLHTTSPIQFSLIQGKSHPFHFTADLDCFFVLTGRAEIVLDAQIYTVSEQGFVVAYPFSICRIACPPDTFVLHMGIQASALQRMGWRAGKYRCCTSTAAQEEKCNRIRKLCASIFQEYFQDQQLSQVHIMQELLCLLDILQQNRVEGGRIPSVKHLELLLQVVSDIHLHAQEGLTLSAAAEHAFVSPSAISTLFTQFWGVTFSEYLLQVRLHYACRAVTDSSQSITHIALDHGFQNTNTFIRQFRTYFHKTPGQYRQKAASGKPTSSFDDGLAGFLQYANPMQAVEPAQSHVVEFTADGAAKGIPLRHSWKQLINVGFARDIVTMPIQQAIQQAQHEIGFSYARFVGIFDDDMRLCDAAGCSYVLADRVFDFLLSAGLRPCIELSGIPSSLARQPTRIYDRAMIVAPCIDLSAWKLHIRSLLLHCIARYGKKEVLEWRFFALNINYAFFGCLSYEEYRSLYQATYEAVKSVDSRLQFGGPGIFLNMLDEAQGMPAFLDFVLQNQSVPDFFTVESWPYHNILHDRAFMDFSFSQQSAPTVLSSDSDFLSHMLDSFQAMLAQYELAHLPVWLEEWNATLWQRDLSNDTCYKAAYLMKNICESYDRVEAFGYWSLSDLLRERPLPERVFHGGYGLFTYNGLPKSGYQALRLLARVGERLLQSGPGWFVTADEQGVQLFLYNYCHYANLYRYRYQQLKQPADAYTVFEEGHLMDLRIVVTGLSAGTYRIRRYHIHQSQGDPFYQWIAMGAPEALTEAEVGYLRDVSAPAYEVQQLACSGTLTVSAQLEPHAVQCILLQRQCGQGE